jgi:hypothetical protein
MALHQFLAGRFSREFVKSSFWQSDMLKGHILLKHLPICSQLSFESATIIGEYFSLRKKDFVDLLGDPGKIHRSEILGYLKNLWDKKMNDFGHDPKDFSDLLMESERARILTSLTISTKNIENNPDSVWDTYLTKGDKKIPVLPFVSYLSDTVLLEGFGGGLYYPDFVRKLWHKSYDILPDNISVNEAVKYGVLSPSEKQIVMEPKPLKERQIQLLFIVKDYVSKYFPDHLELFSGFPFINEHAN